MNQEKDLIKPGVKPSEVAEARKKTKASKIPLPPPTPQKNLKDWETSAKFWENKAKGLVKSLEVVNKNVVRLEEQKEKLINILKILKKELSFQNPKK